MKRQNVRTLSLIVGTFTYLLLGATVFEKLESEHESINSKNFTSIREKIQNKFNMTDEDFEDVQKKIIYHKPYGSSTTQWKFAGSFYFATTVITTIGYGHSTPKTLIGKYFCMAYAMPGIPLCIIMFQSIGERMNTFITWLLRRLKIFCGKKDRKVSQTHLILISSSLGILVLTCGAYVFKTYENWSYQDSFYYCFITLTTIGFGDFVALQRNNTMMKNPKYVAFSLIFILFGLTVVSSVMNLLVLRFLTMNTEDERRDELEAAAQALDLQRLHGDVIFAIESDKETKFHPIKTGANTNQPMIVETLTNNGQNEEDNGHEKISEPCGNLKKFFTHLIEFFQYIPIFLGWKDDPKKNARRGYSYTSAHVICLNDSKGNHDGYVFPDDDDANDYRFIRPAYLYNDDENYEKCYKYVQKHHSALVPSPGEDLGNGPSLMPASGGTRGFVPNHQGFQPVQGILQTGEETRTGFACIHCTELIAQHNHPDLISLSQSSTISSMSQRSLKGHKKRASV